MARSAEAQAIMDYLKKTILPKGAPDITEDTPLVSSGIIDSFALIEILMTVEKVTGRRISPGKVGAKDMDTVTQMLATAERVGVPR